MPAKKRPGKGEGEGKPPKPRKRGRKAAAKGAAKVRADRHALTIAVIGTTPTPPPALTGAAVGEALARRDFLALIGDTDPEAVLDRLERAVMLGSDPDKGWSDALAAAGIPWIAWCALREAMPTAQAMYQAWASLKAHALAGEMVTIANAAAQSHIGETYAEMEMDPDGVEVEKKRARRMWDSDRVAFAKLKIQTRAWMAQRLDPSVFGTKHLIDKRVQEHHTVRIEIVSE